MDVVYRDWLICRCGDAGNVLKTGLKEGENVSCLRVSGDNELSIGRQFFSLFKRGKDASKRGAECLSQATSPRSHSLSIVKM